jgi:hypothetical protein
MPFEICGFSGGNVGRAADLQTAQHLLRVPDVSSAIRKLGPALHGLLLPCRLVASYLSVRAFAAEVDRQLATGLLHRAHSRGDPTLEKRTP